MHFSQEDALPRSQGAEAMGKPAKQRPTGASTRAGESREPGSWHGTQGATHLSVKSSSSSRRRWVREGGMGDGRG